MNQYVKGILKSVLLFAFFSTNLSAQNHFQPIWSAPYLPMKIYVTGADLSGSGSLGTGDEIGIFDGNNCVGSYLLSAQIDPLDPIQIIVSTDDPGSPELDGFIPGNPISYKFWMSALLTEYDQYIVSYALGNGLFVSQGDALVSFTGIFPVELTSFKATVKEKDIELRWETKTEVNNYGFDIERSISNHMNNRLWQTIGFISGNGNSNSPKFYLFTDRKPIGGSEFAYRLKQIDTDGTYEYSGEVQVMLLPTKYELYQNYPNPFNPSTTIRFSLPKETHLKINIYNLLGQLVDTITQGTFEAGYHKVTFNASNLPSGIYVYALTSGNFVDTKKLILLK